MDDGERRKAPNRLGNRGIGGPADIDSGAGVLEQPGEKGGDAGVVVDQQDSLAGQGKIFARNIVLDDCSFRRALKPGGGRAGLSGRRLMVPLFTDAELLAARFVPVRDQMTFGRFP